MHADKSAPARKGFAQGAVAGSGIDREVARYARMADDTHVPSSRGVDFSRQLLPRPRAVHRRVRAGDRRSAHGIRRRCRLLTSARRDAGVTRLHAHVIGVPEAVRSRAELAGADRAIAYELAAGDARSLSAEQWARATWEGAPTIVRWFLLLGWRFVLGLRLVRGRSPTHVLGWRMLDDRADTVTLKARSALTTAHNVVIVEESTVLWTTLVRYERPIARPIWRLAELVHRIVLPYTLTRAGKVRQHERGRQDES